MFNAGPSFEDLLGQSECWYPRGPDGKPVRTKLADMHPNHLMNLRFMLMDRAEGMYRTQVTRLRNAAIFADGEAAQLELERALDVLDEMTPRDWMRTMPLVEAIEQILRDKFPGPKGKEKPHQLTGNERVELRHQLRPIDHSILDFIAALSPATGMPHIDERQVNAQLDSLIEQLRRLRKS